MRHKITILLVLLAASAQSFANSDEVHCKKINAVYKQGLELAAEQVKKFPRAANKNIKGLTLKEIENLEKSKSACEVKALIHAARIKQ